MLQDKGNRHSQFRINENTGEWSQKYANDGEVAPRS